MIQFAKRNLLIFFKDKSAVFFSLMAVFIIIGLYALFLGDAFVSSFDGMEGARWMMDSWIMAGLLGVTSVTTTMGAFGTMIDDKTRKISKDFTASPISQVSITGGYIISAYVIGVIMSLVTAVLAELYILSNGGELMSASVLVKVLLLILLTTLANSSLVLFIVSFFKSSNAFATASTVIGTVIGFITGIYLPIGNLPSTVQWVVKLFPVSHAAALLRQVLMEKPMEQSFVNMTQDEIYEIKDVLGVTFTFGDYIASPAVSILVLIATTVIFSAASICVMCKKR